MYENKVVPVPRFALVGEPTSLDATAYAILANIILVPLDSALKQHALQYPQLEAYCRCMQDIIREPLIKSFGSPLQEKCGWMRGARRRS
jgi:hypothetical protein